MFGWLRKWWRGERRSWLLKDPALAEWWSSLYGQDTAAGVKVDADKALGVPAVYSAVELLAKQIATLPLHVYERLGDEGKRRAVSHRLYWLLHDSPNEEMTAAEFRMSMAAQLLLRNRAFAQIDRDGGGRVRSLWPIHPSLVQVRRMAGALVYEVRTDAGVQRLPASLVLDVRGLTLDGVTVVDPIATQKESIGLAMAGQEFAARFFGNGARPGGVLEHPGVLSDPARERLRATWQAAHGGPAAAHKLRILEEGMKFAKVGTDPDEAQMLESRVHQVLEMARIWRVPPHLIGDTQAQSYASVEQAALHFVTFSLMSWLVILEQAMNLRLFSAAEQGRYFAAHLVDGLLRGDLASRYAAYKVGREGGWLTVNDILRAENLNPAPARVGDSYLQPLNMTTISPAAPGLISAAPGNGQDASQPAQSPPGQAIA